MRQLTPDPHNANKGTQRGRGLLASSLRQYGAGRSILADRHGVVIAGNKTLAAADEIGLPVKVVETDGRELVVVQRTDLDLQHDPAARELAYADNRTSELGLCWDVEQLALDQTAGVNLDAFFTGDELAALLDSLPPALTLSTYEDSSTNDILLAVNADMNSEGDDEDTHAAEQDRDKDADALAAIADKADTAQAGSYVRFADYRIPLSSPEAHALTARLNAYLEETGSYYGFIGRLLRHV